MYPQKASLVQRPCLLTSPTGTFCLYAAVQPPLLKLDAVVLLGTGSERLGRQLHCSLLQLGEGYGP